MKNSDIFKKTMPFVWRRLGMYLLLNIGVILYYALVIFLITLFAAKEAIIGIIIALILCPIGLAIYSFGCRYISYMIKAAHVAAIGELSVTGTIPQGMTVVQFGKSKVKERFVAANVFFGLDHLVTGAVKQIQSMITRVGNVFGNIEIVQKIVSILNLFVEIVLGYVDEAVLARVFYKKDESAWKASADGVVLYFQSWKEILKNAAMLVLMIIGFYAVGMGICYGIFMILSLSIPDIWVLLVIIIAFFIIDVFKQSFLDSWITISVVNKYMQVTINQQPGFDLYEKGKKWSKKFKELCGKAEAEGAVLGAPAAASAVAPTMTAPQPAVAPMTQPVQPGVAQVQQPIQQPAVQQATPQPMMAQPVQTVPVAQSPVAPAPVQPTPVPAVPTQPAPQPVQPTPAPAPQVVQPAPVEMPAPAAPTPVAPAPANVDMPAPAVAPAPAVPAQPVQQPVDPNANGPIQQ